MSKPLRVISINVPFADPSVVRASLDTDRALFDFDVVVIRPSQFHSFGLGDLGTLRYLRSQMNIKREELQSFFLQGGVLIVFLDNPDFYMAISGDWTMKIRETVNKDTVDKSAVRETILTSNGYVDLKPLLGESPFPTSDR